jgi:hypothetical protein
MTSYRQPIAAIFAAVLFVAAPAQAFDTPLSEQAIREAYFLGQRGDEASARFLAKYTKVLPTPKSGPRIASITFFTPFALAVQSSSRQVGYSAQQAQLDHRSQAEFVRVIVQIQFTQSYGSFITEPTGSRSGSTTGYLLRPFDFWKDFDVRVWNARPRHHSPSPPETDQTASTEPLRSFNSHGEPNVRCSQEGGCDFNGATLYFDFPATTFDSGDATIEVLPPEGDPISIDFDLAALR